MTRAKGPFPLPTTPASFCAMMCTSMGSPKPSVLPLPAGESSAGKHCQSKSSVMRPRHHTRCGCIIERAGKLANPSSKRSPRDRTTTIRHTSAAQPIPPQKPLNTISKSAHQHVRPSHLTIYRTPIPPDNHHCSNKMCCSPPVAAMPTRSWPARMMGQHWDWMGEGALKSRVECSTLGGSPVCSNLRKGVWRGSCLLLPAARNRMSHQDTTSYM